MTVSVSTGFVPQCMRGSPEQCQPCLCPRPKSFDENVETETTGKKLLLALSCSVKSMCFLRIDVDVTMNDGTLTKSHSKYLRDGDDNILFMAYGMFSARTPRPKLFSIPDAKVYVNCSGAICHCRLHVICCAQTVEMLVDVTLVKCVFRRKTNFGK